MTDIQKLLTKYNVEWSQTDNQLLAKTYYVDGNGKIGEETVDLTHYSYSQVYNWLG